MQNAARTVHLSTDCILLNIKWPRLTSNNNVMLSFQIHSAEIMSLHRRLFQFLLLMQLIFTYFNWNGIMRNVACFQDYLSNNKIDNMINVRYDSAAGPISSIRLRILIARHIHSVFFVFSLFVSLFVCL